MCILMYFGPGQQPIREHLEEGAANNPHGFGWAIVTFDAVEPIMMGYSMSAKVAIDEFVAMRKKYPDNAALFHARITTSGETSLFNCHPFLVDGRDDIVVAHNGILPCTPGKDDKRSDTHMFADDIFMDRFGKLDSPVNRQRLQEWIGYSKLVVLTTAREFKAQAYIFNEHKGAWYDDNTWYSNESWRKVKPRTYTAWDSEDWGYSNYSSSSATTKYVSGWVEACKACLYRRIDCKCLGAREFTYRPTKEVKRIFVTPVYEGWECAVCECVGTVSQGTWTCLVCNYFFCCNQRKENCECDIRDEKTGLVLDAVVAGILAAADEEDLPLTDQGRQALVSLRESAKETSTALVPLFTDESAL